MHEMIEGAAEDVSAANVRDWEESGRSAEPPIMHRVDETGVSDGKARCGAEDRVNSAIRAERSPSLVLNPFCYITDRKRLFTIEAAANVAVFQLRSVIG